MHADSAVAHGQIQVKRISIADVVGSTEVMVRDGNGWQSIIRSDLRPKGTGAPAKGEIWMIEKVGPIWKLSAMVGVPAKPVITGDRSGSGILTADVLDALSGHGLIDDQTTGYPGSGEGAPGPAGPPGVAGPTGATGDAGVGSFVFTQSAPAATWNITHTLTYTPNVLVVDTSGSVLVGDVDVIDATHIQLLFSVPISGTAYLS